LECQLVIERGAAEVDDGGVRQASKFVDKLADGDGRGLGGCPVMGLAHDCFAPSLRYQPERDGLRSILMNRLTGSRRLKVKTARLLDPRQPRRRRQPHELCIGARARRKALRRDMDRLEEVGLPNTVRPDCENEPGAHRQIEPLVRPEASKMDALDDQPDRAFGPAFSRADGSA